MLALRYLEIKTVYCSLAL